MLTEPLLKGPRSTTRHRLAPVLLIDPPANAGRCAKRSSARSRLPLVPSDRFETAIPFVNARPLMKRY